MRFNWTIVLASMQLIIIGVVAATQPDCDSSVDPGSLCLTESSTLFVSAKEIPPGDYGLRVNNPTSDKELYSAMQPCHPRDCGQGYFFEDALRWIKNTFVDIWAFISGSMIAKTILLIGVSALVAAIAGSNPVVALALQASGFGKGPAIEKLIAAVVRQQIGNDQVASVFYQLLTAAGDGASAIDIQKLAAIAFAGLGTLGAIEGRKLVEASLKPSHMERYSRQLEWRSWETHSRVNHISDFEANMHRRSSWGIPEGKRCVAYGYREYSAPIWVVPSGMSRIDACWHTPNVIHSIGFKTPFKCKDKGAGEIIGIWYVQSNETLCIPYWGHFEDKGCVEYGQRRMSARLHGLSLKDSWNGVCGSTPATLNGIHYGHPTYCNDKGIWGMYGSFKVPDERCKCYCDHS